MSLGPVAFPTLGWQVINWIEAYLPHGPGDIQGDPIVIDDEMARFICWAYRIRKRTGARVFRRAALSRPKGRAKSELAGMLVCAEALGPVRFDGWDANGDPVGRPITSPFIRCLATEEGQAGNTYENVIEMLRSDRIAAEYPGIDVGLTRTFMLGGGEIRPSTASAAAKDGGKETFAVADETHLYALPELKKMHGVVRRNLRKRRGAQPWMLDTTTAWLPGEGSIAEEAADQYAELTLEQMVRKGVLYDHRQAQPVEPWSDDKQLRAALRDVYGPAAEWMDIAGLISEIRDPQNARADSERYWLNRPVAGARQWLDLATWKARGLAGEQIADGELVTLGFDGSRFRDATGLVACRVSDGFLALLDVWERPEGHAGDGWEVPQGEVDAAVHAAMTRFRVWRMYADPPFWQDEVDAWSAEWPETVVRWYTNRDVQMARAVENLHTAIVSAQGAHNGDEVLARHVGNARTRKTRSGVVIEKESRDSPRKIDAAVAAVLAFEARGDAISDGVLHDSSPSEAVFL